MKTTTQSHFRHVPTCLLLVGVLLGGLCFRATADLYEVNGRKIEVSLHFDQPTAMLGEAVSISFRVHNHSDRDLEFIPHPKDVAHGIGPNAIKVEIVGTDRKFAPSPTIPDLFEQGGTIAPQKLPANGHHDFRIFLPYRVRFEEPGIYTISCERRLAISDAGARFSNANAKEVVIDAKATGSLRVTPADSVRMEKIIETLGKELRSNNWDKRFEAANTLSFTEDERVIPHWVWAFGSGDDRLMEAALKAVAKFPDAAAIELLLRGVSLAGTRFDFLTIMTDERAARSAIRLQQAALLSLARNSHPAAATYLRSNFKNLSEDVRATITETLKGAKMPHSQEPTEAETKRETSALPPQFELLSKPKPF